MGSQEFPPALLKLFWGHQDAVVCKVVQGFSGPQKKCKCSDSTGELTVPYVPLMKLAELLAGVLETHSSVSEPKSSQILPLLSNVHSGAEISSSSWPGFPADLYNC